MAWGGRDNEDLNRTLENWSNSFTRSRDTPSSASGDSWPGYDVSYKDLPDTKKGGGYYDTNVTRQPGGGSSITRAPTGNAIVHSSGGFGQHSLTPYAVRPPCNVPDNTVNPYCCEKVEWGTTTKYCYGPAEQGYPAGGLW